LLLSVVALAATTSSAVAQTDGTTGSAVAGGFLGAYSGGLVSNIGSLVWCTETEWGASCVRAMTLAGSIVGGTAGSVFGSRDSEAIKRSAIRSAIGFGIGSAFGIITMKAKSAVGWRDALMLGAVGGAVGARPFGAALGFTGGTLIGWGLSYIVPEFGIPEVAATALAGMAIGVLADWVLSASNAGDDGLATPTISLPLIRLSL
jgi:hypothetical protein